MMIFSSSSRRSLGLGNFLIPLHIGARDVAFPRLNLASYWIFAAGFS